MQNVFVLDHPLIQHKLSILRDKNTPTKQFRELTKELTVLAAYEVTRDLLLQEIEIETPISAAKVKTLQKIDLCILPVLRAGLGMVEGFLDILPTAKVGHIGFYRDPDTLQPVDYYIKLPQDIQSQAVIILDPMLATGGTTVATIKSLRKQGIHQIKAMCLIASEYGISKVTEAYPDVTVYCCAVDEVLNDHGYIVPGLGDAGDRLFGTK